MIGVLVPLRPGTPGRPEARPIGRAALRLEAEGIGVVFGHAARDGALTGYRARPGRWVPVHDVPVVAAYDRYPSQTDPDGYAALAAGLGAVPVANPMSMTLLCRDKLRTQEVLEAAGVRVPAVESDPSRFGHQLASWGTGFLKPRYGAFGRGVRRVRPGDDLPARGEGALAGVIEDLILQRAVLPPTGWAGIAVRVLCQRTPDGWHVDRPIARRSRTDPVVNAARGAEVALAEDAVPDALSELHRLTVAAAEALADAPSGELLVEIGVDAVIDPAGLPWVVEVNSRPRGRLEAIAARDPALHEAHVAACERPLRTLAAWFGAR